MQASQTPIIWTMVICSIVLLVVGLFMVSSINSGISEKNAQLQAQIDADLDAAIGSLQTVAKGLEAPAIDTNAIDELCELTDGCGGWWKIKPAEEKFQFYDEVVNELRENHDKDLFNAIKNLVDVDEKEDIFYVEIYDRGNVRINQKFGEYFDFSDLSENAKATVDMVLKVEYYEDGSTTDKKMKYFRVQATLSNIEDDLTHADVDTVVTKVTEDFVLP